MDTNEQIIDNKRDYPSTSFQALVGASQARQSNLFVSLFVGISLMLSVVAFSNIDLLKVFDSFFSLASSDGIFVALTYKLFDLLHFLAYSVLILTVAYNLTAFCFFISSYTVISFLRSYLFQELESNEFVKRAAHFFAFSRLNNKCVSVSKIKGEFHTRVQSCRTKENPKANFSSKNPIFNLDADYISSNYWVAGLYFSTALLLTVLSYKLGTSMIDSKICMAALLMLIPTGACIWVRHQYIKLKNSVCEKISTISEIDPDTPVALHKELGSLESANEAPLPKTALEKKFYVLNEELHVIFTLLALVSTLLIAFLSPGSQIKYTQEQEDTLAVNALVTYVQSSSTQELKFKLKSTEANGLSIIKLSEKDCGIASKSVKIKDTFYCTSTKTPDSLLKDVISKVEVKKD